MISMYKTLVTALLLVTAQNVWSQPQRTQAIEAGDGQFWWDNHKETDSRSWWRNGKGAQGRYNAAVFIPGDFFGKEGMTISAISVIPRYAHVKNVEAWISRKLPEFGAAADLETVSLANGDLTFNAFNDVAFSKAYEIPKEGLYIGFSFDSYNSWLADYNRCLLSSRNAMDREGGFFWNCTAEPQWQKGDGNLVIRALVTGEKLENAAKLLSFTTPYLAKGSTMTVPVKIQNVGTNPVKGIKYALMEGSDVIEEGFRDVTVSDFMDVGTFYINMKASNTEGAVKRTIVIQEVNNLTNDCTSNSVTGRVVTIVDKPKVLPVVEEYTGTWCGYCPYGIEAMKDAHQKHGDNVALIAVHYNDAMQTYDCQSLYGYIEGYPCATINRGSSFDPQPPYLATNISDAMSNVAAGTIEATAKWSDPERTAIDIDTKTAFVYSENDAHYGIAYVLVEDGMKGEGYNWAQRNYLTGGSGSSYYDFWYNAEDYVYGLEFDHVAVAAWDVKTGISGSVGSTIVKGQKTDFSYKADISTNALIQDKSKLRLVALLVDSQSSAIINAALVDIETPDVQTGDSNGDGVVDINDALAIFNYVIGKPASTFNAAAADMNGDGTVDIADAVKIVNILMGKE